ncbi:Unknown protein [Striga hermonthica]|uniref:CCHC-type domain-containing protein n=1 Tax=Striga hermonthica TaxID=68872 RepID=A0A9N7MSK1_STRHE|nr:Unknown protein [Striga hermonthica]
MAERRPHPTGSHGQLMPGLNGVPLVSHFRILHPPVLAGQNRPSVVNEWLFEQEHDGFRTEIRHIVADHGSLAYAETIHRVQQIVASQSLQSVARPGALPVAQPVVQPVAQPTGHLAERGRKRKRAHKRGKRGGAGRRDDRLPAKNAQPVHQFPDGPPRCNTCGSMHGGECRADRRICYHCRKRGHFANMCPERDQPQNQEQVDEPAGRRICYLCRKRGHFANMCLERDQPQNQEQVDEPAGRRICYHCRKRGHFANMCPERDQPGNQPQNQEQVDKPAGRRICYHCRKRGHFAYMCPERDQPQNQEQVDEPAGG